MKYRSTCSSPRIIPTTFRILARRRRRRTTTPAGRWRSRWASQFDRILEPFSGPFGPITDWNVKPPPGKVATGRRCRLRVQPRGARSFVALNRLLARMKTCCGYRHRWRPRKDPSRRHDVCDGAAVNAPADPADRSDRGVSFDATSERAPATAWKLKRSRESDSGI